MALTTYLTKPISFSEDIIKMVNLGKLSSDAIGLYCITEEIKLLKRVISSHMGQWNKSNYSSVELPKPSDKYEFFVHMCDYLSSKKFLEVSFDEQNKIKTR